MDYHIGKLNKEISTTVPEAFCELLSERARASNCKPSDLIREGMFFLLTGDSYSAHVAKDMTKLFGNPSVNKAEISGESRDFDANPIGTSQLGDLA